MKKNKVENISNLYREKFSLSERAYLKAQDSVPQGVSSNIRGMFPFPIFSESAMGSRKTTIEKVSLIDHWMGHASLLFGHSDKDIIDAVSIQLKNGTHFASPNILEQEVATLIKEQMLWPDRVRFCGTGSESVALALRVSRAKTNKKKIIRFLSHYHGWHDELIPGVFLKNSENLWGINSNVLENQIILPPNNIEEVNAIVGKEDIAAIILEANGGFGGAIENNKNFLQQLRKIATENNIILIFDEMISGFRYSKGGASAFYDVRPDLVTLGKALFGGFPGAALAGKAELMDLLGPSVKKHVTHQGTWNGSPLSLSAAKATLEKIDRLNPYSELSKKGEVWRGELKRVLDHKGVEGRVYGEASLFHICLGKWPLKTGLCPSTLDEVKMVQSARLEQTNIHLRAAMLINGVDIFPFHMNALSMSHNEDDLQAILSAFSNSLELL